ncbi:MAG: thioesterase domain-containing protein [Lentisphaeria bacterium]|jgi:thioesterase domain-containing protein
MLDVQLDSQLIEQKSVAKVVELVLQTKEKISEKIKIKPKIQIQNMVMPLNSGKGKPSLYLICGITLYSPLAKNLSGDFACFGIYVPQEKLFFKHAKQNNDFTVSYLASLYVDAIYKHAVENTLSKNTPPRLALGGVSFGGVLAFEIARQLTQNGCEVSGLIMLDTVLPGALTRPWSLTLKSLIKKIRVQIGNIQNIITNNSTSVKMSAREVRKVELLAIIRGKATQAYLKGHPTFSGPTLIVRAAEQYGHIVEPSLCWHSRLRGPVYLGEAAGEHLEILQSPETAKLIAAHIN